MKQLEPLLGFEVKYGDDGLIEVDVNCKFPQEQSNCMELYKRLELIKIDESKVTFPLRLVHWIVTINPIDTTTIMTYFNIDGIKKIVDDNKSKLIDKTTFIKPEIQYPKKSKYPILHIHFYQIAEEEGMYIIDEYDMVESCLVHYENTKQFTNKRMAELEKLVNTQELCQIPFLPIEMVRFNENGDIQDFEQHLFAKSSVKLPF